MTLRNLRIAVQVATEEEILCPEMTPLQAVLVLREQAKQIKLFYGAGEEMGWPIDKPTLRAEIRFRERLADNLVLSN